MLRYLPKGKIGRLSVVLLYGIIYMTGFFYLENRTLESYHIIECGLDRMIPFYGIFIIPYLMWFPYQFILLGYFLLGALDHKEFYRFMSYVCGGMTCFLFVSFLYPTALELRPVLTPGGSVCNRLLQGLYYIDTPTNVLPSIHVYNSVVFHIVFCHSFAQGEGRKWKSFSFVLILLIIVSTVLIKQHSVIDIVMGFVMAGVGYLLIYCRELRQEVLAKQV